MQPSRNQADNDDEPAYAVEYSRLWLENGWRHGVRDGVAKAPKLSRALQSEPGECVGLAARRKSLWALVLGGWERVGMSAMYILQML